MIMHGIKTSETVTDFLKNIVHFFNNIEILKERQMRLLFQKA